MTNPLFRSQFSSFASSGAYRTTAVALLRRVCVFVRWFCCCVLMRNAMNATYLLVNSFQMKQPHTRNDLLNAVEVAACLEFLVSSDAAGFVFCTHSAWFLHIFRISVSRWSSFILQCLEPVKLGPKVTKWPCQQRLSRDVSRNTQLIFLNFSRDFLRRKNPEIW